MHVAVFLLRQIHLVQCSPFVGSNMHGKMELVAARGGRGGREAFEALVHVRHIDKCSLVWSKEIAPYLPDYWNEKCDSMLRTSQIVGPIVCLPLR